MNFSENLKKLRKENNLSQEMLSEKLGVSRQSVSKWESNQAYPELDKLNQISKLFNVNIDDLLNNDVKEKHREKLSNISFNKYLDSFFEYITKSVNLFCSMTFKTKMKCIFEQIIMILFLIIFGVILNEILFEGLFYNLLFFIPENIKSILINVVSSLFVIAYIIFSIITIFKIFKNRYLDYFEYSKEDKDKVVEKEKTDIKIEKKNKKIVIRDHQNNDYNFFIGIIKIFKFFLKVILGFFAGFLSFLLIISLIFLVLSFLIIKTKLFFVGIFLSILSTVVILLIFIIVFINFIINRKNNKKIFIVTFLTSLIVLGLGLGLTFYGLTKFDYINKINKKDFVSNTYYIDMNNKMKIHDVLGEYNANKRIKFIEENRDNLKVKTTHSKIVNINYSYFTDDDTVNLNFHFDDSDGFKTIKTVLNDLNNYKIIDYNQYKITIYTSKENIDILKNLINNEKIDD